MALIYGSEGGSSLLIVIESAAKARRIMVASVESPSCRRAQSCNTSGAIHARRGRERSSLTAISAHGIPSTATGDRLVSSTGTAPGPSTRWPTSPQPPGPSCRSPRPGSSPKRDSIHSLTCLPGSARSWTPTACLTGKRFCRSYGHARWTSPNSWDGSKASVPGGRQSRAGLRTGDTPV